MVYHITKQRLRKELELAYYLARYNNKKKRCVLEFEKNLEENLDNLTEVIYNRDYNPKQSFCFIIHEPKIREIFAASFVDRIVHHLYYNMLSKLYDRCFVEDSYSCREGKGCHYGVRRLYGHIKKATHNYTREAYVLQLDIKGYFININRRKLLEITERIFDKDEKKFEDRIDFDFVRWLNRIIILNNPADNCIVKSPSEEWDGLPDSKSLFKTKEDCGLPIGNLTSQLLSNVYLNELDQYVKRELKCKHYGRYVDDLYIVSEDKEYLRYVAKKIDVFLREKLGLELNQGKTRITSTKQGVKFLGYFAKHHRIYISNSTLKRINRKLDGNVSTETINSYLGMLKHARSYGLRKSICDKLVKLKERGIYNIEYTKYKPYSRIKLL